MRIAVTMLANGAQAEDVEASIGQLARAYDVGGVQAPDTPKAKADHVLEVNAGVADEMNLKVGDEIHGLTEHQ